jgi:hypothetical protein
LTEVPGLAVIWDTFKPLRLTTLWQQHDNPDHAHSWNRIAGLSLTQNACIEAGDMSAL